MKYFKFLSIALFAFIAFISCYKPKVYVGPGNGVVQFDFSENNKGEQVLYVDIPENLSETHLVKIPVSYVNEPTAFPFSVKYDAEINSDAGVKLEDAIWLTDKRQTIFFGEGPTEDASGNKVPMRGTSYLEFKVVNRPGEDKGAVIKFTLKDPTNSVKLGDNKTFTVNILNMD